MMPEVILVLRSSVFLYTLQQRGKAVGWGSHGTRIWGAGQAWGGDRQAPSVTGTKHVPHCQHRGDRKG